MEKGKKIGVTIETRPIEAPAFTPPIKAPIFTSPERVPVRKEA